MPPTASLEQLAQRVAELESRLQLTSSEQNVPTFITLDAAGNISAQFSGHLIANALDLPSHNGLFTAPNTDCRITWTDPVSGTQDADIFGNNSGTGVSVLMLGTRPTNGEPRNALIFQTTAALADSITVFSNNGTIQQLLMNSQRVSGFLNWGPGNAQRGEQCQLGSFTAAVPLGNSTQTANFIGGPWTTSATNAIVWITSPANNTVTLRACGAQGLTGVYVNLDSTVAQNVTFGYLAFGH